MRDNFHKRPTSVSDFQVGDGVKLADGSYAEVVRVNKKTIKIKLVNGNLCLVAPKDVLTFRYQTPSVKERRLVGSLLRTVMSGSQQGNEN